MVFDCRCEDRHEREQKRVVLTGGPGGGKTAVLEVVRHNFCKHVVVLPEAASILFKGGFPRTSSVAARKAAQRSIFHVQREIETLMEEETEAGVVLCDRGTIDGLAYWPGSEEAFFRELGITKETEFVRYCAVIHLRTPTDGKAYQQGGLRIESLEQAAAIDGKIAQLWRQHPHYVEVPATTEFIDKVRLALAAIRREVPKCCLHSRLREETHNKESYRASV